MNEKSLVEIAYDIVSESKGPIAFKNLWKAVTKEKGLSEEEANLKVSQFLTNLLLDGRFVTFQGNVWDLKARYKFDTVHQDLSGYYSEEENVDDGDEEEAIEEKEYNEVFEQKNTSRDDELELEPTDEDDGGSNDNL